MTTSPISDDDLIICGARYALVPAVRAFIDRQGCSQWQLHLLCAAFTQAVEMEVDRRSNGIVVKDAA